MNRRLVRWPAMKVSVGILAFGSLIDNPGAEIEAVLVGRKPNVRTPFGVEFGRTSIKRGGTPTLVPLQQGGRPVLAQILLVSVSEKEAKDRLWRREVNRIGQGGHYTHSANPGPNTLVIDRYENFEGVEVVLAARFAPTIVPHRAETAAGPSSDRAPSCSRAHPPWTDAMVLNRPAPGEFQCPL